MSRHVRGESRARKHARLATKPTYVKREHRNANGELRARNNTGGGYEHVRSCERVEDDPRDHAIDVYASHHRLLAVAWNVARRGTGESVLPEGYEGLVDMGELVGDDVHHNAPEADDERGIPWDNREDVLVVEDHGAHSGLTNAEREAYAADAKRVRDGEVSLDPTCAECGADDPGWSIEGEDEVFCVRCASEQADGRTVTPVDT